MKAPFKPCIDHLEDRLVLASVVIGESTFDPQLFGQNIHGAMEGTVVGFGYAITSPNGAIVAEGGDGFARTATDGELAFTSDSRMEIASSAKTITAAAVVKLLFSQGKTIDEPIGGYFPASWAVPAAVSSLTFRDLLNHTSGFNIRRLDYADLKDLVEGGPQVAQNASGYNTTNYSLLRVMLPYMLVGEDRAELDDVSEDHKPELLAGIFLDYVNTEVLVPLGVPDASTGHTSETPTLLYNFPDDGTAGYETGDQRLHVGGMGWNLSAAQLAKFMAGLGNHPDFTEVYQAMRDDQLGLSDTSSGLFGTYFGKGGNNFPQNNDQGSGAGPNRVNTMMVDFPNDIQVAIVRNSDGGVPVLRTSYENAWTGMVVQGDEGDNVFQLRRNDLDANLLDLVVDGSLFFSFRIDVLQSLELRGLGGSDTFLIEDSPVSLDLILNGGAGQDSFVLGNPLGNSVFDHLLGNLTVVGGDGGSDGLFINDPNGFSSEYSIRGIDNAEITYDGVIHASSHTPGKLFVFDTVEDIVLVGNTDPNLITVRDIAAGMNIEIRAGFNDDIIQVHDIASTAKVVVHGEGGNDTVEVWNLAPDAQVQVFGDVAYLPGGADTVRVGRGDLGTVQGSVFFDGAGGADLLVLDDRDAPVGRDFQIYAGTITGSDGFGFAAYSELVETIQILGSEHDDTFNVESLGFRTDLELFGNLGSDGFTIAAVSRNVDLVAGDVTIHGEKGYLPSQETNNAAPVEKDQLHVFDDLNTANGDFAINLHAGVLSGRVNKLGLHGVPLLNVVYDQVETTQLRTGGGNDHVALNAAPWFNQVSIHAGAGKDAIDVEGTPPFTGATLIDGGAGSDTIRVSPVARNLNSLHSKLIVQGGTGAAGERDKLAVDDSLSGNANPYLLSSTTVARNGSAGIKYATIEDLVVKLSNANNFVNVASTAPKTDVHIDGMAGNDQLTARNLASRVHFNGGLGNDRAVLFGTPGVDQFLVSGATTTLGAGSLTTSVERREIDGLAGRDRLALVSRLGVNDAMSLRPSTTPNTGRADLNAFTPIYYAGVEEMFAQGNAGDLDTLQVNGQTQNGMFGGGVHHDRFTINLAAAGTSKDPFLVLRNTLGQSLLTLADYRSISVPKVNGLLGADVFDVHASPAGTQNRRVQLDGGGRPLGLKGDQLNVHYVNKGAKSTWTPTTPKDGKIAIEYRDLFFAIYYQNMESTKLHRI